MPPQWDPVDYDERFSYVSYLGRGAVEWLAPRQEERILDVGCGTGSLSAQIAMSGATVCGIDSDAGMIARAAANHPNIEFRVTDARDFSASEPFDAVFSNAALHWIPHPHDVVAAVVDALVPGGRFVGELGGERNIEAILGALRRACVEVGLDPETVGNPWYFPSLGEYARVLEAGGFVVRRMAYFERPTPLDDCQNGVVDWLHMFGGALLDGISESKRELLTDLAVEHARPSLLRDGRWYADYRRLRFAAERV